MDLHSNQEHPLDRQLAAGLRGDFELGWELAEELQRLTPDDPRANFNRAWYEMRRGHLLKGFELLDAGRWIEVFGSPPLRTTKPIWRNESLTNKYLLLVSEGGLGDEIINARFAKNFAQLGAKVIVACDRGLMSLFSRIEGVTTVVTREAAEHVHHDYWVPAMSAGRVLEIEYSTLSHQPYLTADPSYIEKWRFALDKAFPKGCQRIGLRFSGNPKFEHEQHRRFPQGGLLGAVGGRPWVSLQQGESQFPLESWEDTLAIIAQLDLVITSCTSVAHASAALGKATWILVPVMPYYIWALPGETSPWYRNVRLFRQSRFGHWQDVFDRIQSSLTDWEHQARSPR